MKLSWLIVGIFAGRFCATALGDPPGDGDLGWQRWLGAHVAATLSLPRRLGSETFTAPGAGWVPQEWLFSLLAYVSAASRLPILALICVLCATLALAGVAYAARRNGAHSYATAAAVSLAGFGLAQSFGVRAQVFAWPLFVAYLLLIECDGNIAYGAVLVAVVWSNLHASVMLAPVLATVVCCGNYLDRGWDARTRRTVTIAVLSACATCANPLGWKIPLYAFTLVSSPFTTMIREWHRTSLTDVSFAFGALPLIVCILAFGTNGAQRWRDRLVLAVFAWLMFSAARNVALFVLAAAPLAAASLTAGVPFLRERMKRITIERAWGGNVPVAVSSLLLACIVGAGYLQSARGDRDRGGQPLEALAAIAALPGDRNVLCADFAWCSYLLGSPRARVFLDGRADPYPQQVWSDFARIVRVEPLWRRTLRDRGVDVVLVARDAPLEAALALAPGWRSAYVDAEYRVWERRLPADATAERSN